ELLDAGVVKAHGLAFGFGDEGDVGLGGERDAEAGAADSLAQTGAGVDVDDDAVVFEGDGGVFGEDEAGGGGVALDVVAGVWAGEELGAEGALEGGGGDFYVDGAGRRSEDE